MCHDVSSAPKPRGDVLKPKSCVCVSVCVRKPRGMYDRNGDGLFRLKSGPSHSAPFSGTRAHQGLPAAVQVPRLSRPTMAALFNAVEKARMRVVEVVDGLARYPRSVAIFLVSETPDATVQKRMC